MTCLSNAVKKQTKEVPPSKLQITHTNKLKIPQNYEEHAPKIHKLQILQNNKLLNNDLTEFGREPLPNSATANIAIHTLPTPQQQRMKHKVRSWRMIE